MKPRSMTAGEVDLIVFRNSARAEMGVTTIVAALIVALALMAQVGTRFAWAASQGAPKGPVILTIAGKITKPNRPGLQENLDGFFKHHELRFAKAREFDRAMLAALPQHKIKARWSKWKQTAEFTGPRLSDVLASAGAENGTVRIMALDGYATDLKPADLAAKDWMVALNWNGKPLGIGRFGPTMVVHTPAAGVGVAEAEEQKWVWAILYRRGQ